MIGDLDVCYFAICLYNVQVLLAIDFYCTAIRPMFVINKHFNYHYPMLVWWFRFFFFSLIYWQMCDIIERWSSAKSTSHSKLQLTNSTEHNINVYDPWRWKKINVFTINHIRSYESGKCDVSYVQWISDSIFAFAKFTSNWKTYSGEEGEKYYWGGWV